MVELIDIRSDLLHAGSSFEELLSLKHIDPNITGQVITAKVALNFLSFQS